MGNSHSQHHQIPITQWTQSYPRLRHSQPQVKVLPERVPPLQLRTTDNGAILQNGGTISCRKQSTGQEERIHRPRSSSAHRPPKPENITLDKTRFGSEPDLRFHLKESRDQYSDNAVRQRISRSRKKYKAPPAPQNGMGNGVESSSPDLNGWEANGRECAGVPCRRGRLFKTRAESSKKNVTSLRTQSKEESEISRSTEALNVVKPKFKEEKFHQGGSRMEKKGLKRSASQEVISTKKSLATPEFQAEIVEVAQRLRASGTRDLPSQQSHGIPKNEMLTSLKIEIPKESDLELNKKMMKNHDAEETGKKCQGSETRYSRAEELKEKSERDVPFKKFYFGMKENDSEIKIVNNSASTNNVDKTNAEHRLTAVEKSKNLMNLYKSVAEGGQEWEDTADKFAANFHKAQMSMPNGNTTSCSSSFVSDPDEEVDGGIALQLRPTLPKKTLEIPRFSPTAAWRLLSSIDACPQAPSPGGSEDGPLLLEDRIHPPAPQHGLRSSHDKSGDSGISGDASPGGCHESSSEIAATSPKPPPTQNSKNILVAWTPQQDLEEESSSDDLELPLNSSKNAACKIPGARFSSRGQLFVSRDQPFPATAAREDSLCLYTENGDFKERIPVDLTPRLNSLRKLKVGLTSAKQYDGQDERNHSPNDNWVLSRSVPSSLNNSHVAATRSISNPSSPEQDDECGQQTSLNYPSYSYIANGGRIMYLPEYHARMSPDVTGKKPKNNACYGFLSKSCENITQPEMQQVRRSRSPSPMGIPNREETRSRSDASKPNQKKKKFTFQSTVRLLENRRIAERLSREAELKENQRLSELEAMKKVEEEFQKKRAREKANIRHQLRLFSLEEKNYSSLPPFDWEENRGDSAGAPSSLPHVVQSHPSRKLSTKKIPSTVDVNKFAQTTQVLSEYREPTRDYKDYRHSRFQEPQEFVTENAKRSVVEHPRVVYDMPKNTPVYVSAPVNPFAQNQFKDEPVPSKMGLSTPRSSSSDNYRKDFAHGALPNSGRSLTSSDSELSQSHPRCSSRQGLPPRGFAAQHRSRSASPQSLTPASSPQGFDSVGHPPRSRSVSPVKMVIGQRNRCVTADGSTGVGRHNNSDINNSNNSPVLEKKLATSIKPLERKLSDPNDYQTNVLQVLNLGGATNKHEPYGKVATDSLLRLGLPSLQPFNKSEKSFRPINFNPVINKLAQIVT